MKTATRTNEPTQLVDRIRGINTNEHDRTRPNSTFNVVGSRVFSFCHNTHNQRSTCG